MSNDIAGNQVQLVHLGGAVPQTKEKAIMENKFFSRLETKARANTKSNTCYLCGRTCDGFCKSHSIPKFVLKRIAKKGKVISFIDREMQPYAHDSGVNNAGTFFIICDNCDNTVFQKYENPDSYEQQPADVMLAQIAMKNYLQMIWKRTVENEMYRLLMQRKPESKTQAKVKIFWGQEDLANYTKRFSYAKENLTQHDGYHLCYYKKLDYVVPLATQSAITLLCDFEDQIINNIYNPEDNTSIEPIHISVFPLESSTVIMMFIEQGEKKNRRFYRQLKKLPENDQLAAINYIIFSYTENVYVYGPVADMVQSDIRFKDTYTKTHDYYSFQQPNNPLPTAIREFSLTRRNEIPNLLSKEYAI